MVLTVVMSENPEHPLEQCTKSITDSLTDYITAKFDGKTVLRSREDAKLKLDGEFV